MVFVDLLASIPALTVCGRQLVMQSRGLPQLMVDRRLADHLGDVRLSELKPSWPRGSDPLPPKPRVLLGLCGRTPARAL